MVSSKTPQPCRTLGCPTSLACFHSDLHQDLMASPAFPQEIFYMSNLVLGSRSKSTHPLWHWRTRFRLCPRLQSNMVVEASISEFRAWVFVTLVKVIDLTPDHVMMSRQESVLWLTRAPSPQGIGKLKSSSRTEGCGCLCRMIKEGSTVGSFSALVFWDLSDEACAF